jgi:hypothetical protein
MPRKEPILLSYLTPRVCPRSVAEPKATERSQVEPADHLTPQVFLRGAIQRGAEPTSVETVVRSSSLVALHWPRSLLTSSNSRLEPRPQLARWVPSNAKLQRCPASHAPSPPSPAWPQLQAGYPLAPRISTNSARRTPRRRARRQEAQRTRPLRRTEDASARSVPSRRQDASPIEAPQLPLAQRRARQPPRR